MPGRPSSKKINFPARKENIVPYNDLSILMDMGKLKEEVAEMEPKRKLRLIALLASMYPRSQVELMAGISKSYIALACRKNRDIVEAAQLGRNMSIVGLAERKVFETLMRINPDKMHEDKKAQSARNLMEVAEMATAQIRPREKEDDVDTMSLIFQIKKHIKPKEVDVEQDEPIEVEAKVLGDAK
jgi:hypothetical protein